MKTPSSVGHRGVEKDSLRESFFLPLILSPPIRDGSVLTDLGRKGACNQGGNGPKCRLPLGRHPA